MISLRAMVPGDEHFVYSSWLESYSRSRWARRVPRPYYFADQRRIIRERIETGRVLVACAADDPDTILGWSCTGPELAVHYVFVKKSARGEGLARRLLEPFVGKPCIATCAMQDEDYAQKNAGAWRPWLPEGWRYDPYLVTKREETAA